VVALLADVGFHDLESWLADIDMRENPVVILLDHLEDPHNVGAIIRTAVATGCAGVIVPKHEMAALHGATVKASAGQIFKMPLIRIVNVNQTLVRLQEAGFWVAGLAMNAPQDIWNFRADMPLVVVAGNEAKGISLATAKYCDMMLSIPMKNGVESLNVSVSTSLVLYEIMRKRL
jgi:23S rRNA (guanosine2251-2'-O)-methyltransferase